MRKFDQGDTVFYHHKENNIYGKYIIYFIDRRSYCLFDEFYTHYINDAVPRNMSMTRIVLTEKVKQWELIDEDDEF